MAEVAPASKIASGTCVINAFPSVLARQLTGVINFVGEYALPLGVIVACYAAMVRKMRSRVGQPFQFDGAPAVRTFRIRRNILRTLFTVVVVIVVSLTPKEVMLLMYSVGNVSIVFSGVPYNFSVLLVYFDTCVNPFIYLFQYREFQRGLVLLLGRQRKVGVAETVEYDIQMRAIGSRKSYDQRRAVTSM